MSFNRADLFGAWAFVDWTVTYDDGRVSRPFQPQPGGYIIYTENGIMSAVIHGSHRKPFASADIRKQSSADKADAFDSYFHYAGPWHVRGDSVVHSITTALNPNMIGTEQVRYVELNGDSLVLSADEALEGARGQRHHRLTWRRVGAA